MTMEPVVFTSAYQQLKPNEREFVDGFVVFLERENANVPFERLTTTLQRAADNVRLDEVDSRTRDFFNSPLVKAAVNERVNEIAAARDLSPEWIVNQHRAIAAANLEDFTVLDDSGFPWPDLRKLSRDQWYALESVETVEEDTKFGVRKKLKLKLINKLASLDFLAKHTGIDQAGNATYEKYAAIPTTVSSATSLEQLAEDYAQLINAS